MLHEVEYLDSNFIPTLLARRDCDLEYPRYDVMSALLHSKLCDGSRGATVLNYEL